MTSRMGHFLLVKHHQQVQNSRSILRAATVLMKTPAITITIDANVTALSSKVQHMTMMTMWPVRCNELHQNAQGLVLLWNDWFFLFVACS